MSTSDLKEILAVGLFRKLAAAREPSSFIDVTLPDGGRVYIKGDHFRKKLKEHGGDVAATHKALAAEHTRKPKLAEGESLGPSQDTQAVGQAQQKPKTLQELMGTQDVQKWFRGSVGGLAKRSQIPYALLQPGQDPQTNMQQEELRAILQQILAAKAEKQAAFIGTAGKFLGKMFGGGATSHLPAHVREALASVPRPRPGAFMRKPRAPGAPGYRTEMFNEMGFQRLPGRRPTQIRGELAARKPPADAVYMSPPDPAAVAAAKQRMQAELARMAAMKQYPAARGFPKMPQPRPDATMRGV